MKPMIFFSAILLSGCATMEGVNATKDERRACAAETCSVWTDRELRALIQRAMQEGYKAGAKPSGRGA
jgi:PBP1b-binding outer membrane lipoprotein LpoB